MARAIDVAADLLFRLLQRAGRNFELPLDVRAHLLLHRVDFPWPTGLVGVGVVADDLRGDGPRSSHSGEASF